MIYTCINLKELYDPMVYKFMTDIAVQLESKGYQLRLSSFHTNESAYELKIKNLTRQDNPNLDVKDFCNKFFPDIVNKKNLTKKCLRIMQILGENLDDHVDFIITDSIYYHKLCQTFNIQIFNIINENNQITLKELNGN